VTAAGTGARIAEVRAGGAPIVAVTVLEDRAAITRRGTIALGAGQHRLAIERVAPVLADKTLTATATGARVLDVRCERRSSFSVNLIQSERPIRRA
jgi:hypothetical protein